MTLKSPIPFDDSIEDPSEAFESLPAFKDKGIQVFESLFSLKRKLLIQENEDNGENYEINPYLREESHRGVK